MTYFLTGTDTEVPITTPDVKPATWFQGLGAATESMMRRSDGFYGEKHTRDFVTIEKMDPILRKVGIDALNEYYTANDAGYDHLRPAPENVDDFVAMHGDRAWDMVSEVAKEQAAADPAAWAGIDLSGEDITAETNQRLQDDQADADAILNSMPSGRGMAELVGGMVGMVADPRNVPFLLAGGGSGSLLSIMGREALLNVTAEAVTLPSRFKMADILEEPDPDVTETLLMAAGAGAVFGGAIEGLGRALHYFRGRSEVRTALPGLSKQDSDLVITAVEDALVKGVDPVQAMTRTMDDIGTARVAEAEGRPIDLDEVFGEAKTRLAPERVPDAPFTVAPKTATALPADVPLPKVETTAVAERASRYSAARAFDVDAFSALESSQRRAETFRRWIADLGGDQDGEVAAILAKADARIAEIDKDLSTLKTGGKRALRDERKKVVQARAEAEGLRGRTETRDMAQVRRDLMAEDVKMRDLGPRLAAAYRKADAEKVAADWPWSPKAAERVAGWSPKMAAKVQARAVRESPAPKVASTSPVAKAFSDPASKEARVVQDTIVADFQDQIAKGEDLTVDLGDGKGPRTMSAIIKDMEADEAFVARLDLCGLMGGPTE